MTRTRPATHTLRLAALAVGVALGASACAADPSGSDQSATRPAAPSSAAASTDRSPDEALEAATVATLDADRFTVEHHVVLEPHAPVFESLTTGRADLAAAVCDLTFTSDLLGNGQTTRVLSDGRTAWVAVTAGEQPGLPGGATYVGVDAATFASDVDDNPARILEMVHVLRAGDAATAAGVGTVDGVETRRYVFTTTPSAALRAAGDDAEALDRALELFTHGEADLDVEVEVGPDDVVRSLRVAVGPALENGDTGALHTLDLSDVGERVAPPVAPAAGDVSTGEGSEDAYLRIMG